MSTAEHHSEITRDPLAIVGMACRLPGDVSSPSDLWDLLMSGRSGRDEIPLSRFNKSGFFHTDSQYSGCINTDQGYFLTSDPYEFDNEFFGINNLEAKYMDPQQRQLLEIVYECAESAGYTLESMSGANIGCYIANFTVDYSIIQAKDPELFHRYSATGLGAAILANRITHTFNLTGPSLTLDTACSGSIYALHLACSALRNLECSAAFVGGANLILSPDIYIAAVKAGMTSGSATCHTFDVSADGYARAEGVGALMVKRLSDALRDGDPIRSVIRGIAVNSNGTTNGISLPSPLGQAAVISKAYIDAGLPPDQTDYIEAHGTGTVVGDATEVEAFSKVIKHRSGRPNLIGSVKTNLGHSEAVSGITSIIKATLALENSIIPPTIGIERINPTLKLERRNARVVTESMAWPATACGRVSINSFGYGGSNGHVVLEQAPRTRCSHQCKQQCHQLLLYSGNTRKALVQSYDDIQRSNDSTQLQDLAFTLACRRSSLRLRGYSICNSEGTILKPLSSLSIERPLRALDATHPTFIFTGQGSQWSGMGAELFKCYPVYKSRILELDQYLQDLINGPKWSVLDHLLLGTELHSVNDTQISQPICTILQIALVDLLAAIGIVPVSVIGHSSGEIAAAYAAGFITDRLAVAIAYYRGQVVASNAPSGSIAAVGAPAEQVTQLIQRHNISHVDIACFNSPKSTTISGDPASVEAFVHIAEQEQIFMYENQLEQVLGEIRPISRRQVIMLSSLKGCRILPEDVSTAAYWRANLEQPVLFSAALQGAVQPGSVFIEVGPHSTLKGPVQDIWKSQPQTSELSYFSILRRHEDSALAFLTFLGDLYLDGIDTPARLVNGGDADHASEQAFGYGSRTLIGLPTYPWDHNSILKVEGTASTEYRNRRHPRHELLGSPAIEGAGYTRIWRNRLRIADVTWLTGHCVGDTIIFPAAGYLSMVTEAVLQLHPDRYTRENVVVLRHVELQNFLVFHDTDTAVEVLTELTPKATTELDSTTSRLEYSFAVCSVNASEAIIHSSGLVTIELTHHKLSRDRDTTGPDEYCEPVDLWYKKLSREGLSFDGDFRSISKLATTSGSSGGESSITLADIRLPKFTSLFVNLLHPVHLDAALQASIISTASGHRDQLRRKIPVSIAELTLRLDGNNSSSDNKISTIHAKCNSHKAKGASVNSILLDRQDCMIAEFNTVVFKPWSSPYTGKVEYRQPFLELSWKPDIRYLLRKASLSLNSYLKEPYIRSEDSVNHLNRTVAKVVELQYHVLSRRIEVLFASNEEGRSCRGFAGGLDDQSFHLSTKLLTSLDELETEPDLIDDCDHSTQSSTNLLDITTVFDVIYCDTPPTYRSLMALKRHLQPHGSIITPSSVASLDISTSNGLRRLVVTTSEEGIEGAHIYSAIHAKPETSIVQQEPVFLIHSSSPSDLEQELITELPSLLGKPLTALSLRSASMGMIPPSSIIIYAAEMGEERLASMDQDQLQVLQALTNIPSTFIWVQSGHRLSAQRPDQTMIYGLSRTAMMENPRLRFCIIDFDVDQALGGTLRPTLPSVGYVFEHVLRSPKPDLEFVVTCDNVWVSRFSPVKSLNDSYKDISVQEARSQRLSEVGSAVLSTKSSGDLDTTHFLEEEKVRGGLQPSLIRIQTMAVSINHLNSKDLRDQVAFDALHTLDFSGIVTDVGSEVRSFRLGVRVVGMFPHRIGTYIEVPEWACMELQEEEAFTDAAMIPTLFAITLYGMEDKAQVKHGESILICDCTTDLGLTCLQLSLAAGANIYVTVKGKKEKDLLIRDLQVREQQIHIQDSSSLVSWSSGITGGCGFDVVVNTTTTSSSQKFWEVCSDSGRYLDVCYCDIDHRSQPPASWFVRERTYHVVDLNFLGHSKFVDHRAKWTRLLSRALQSSRDGLLKNLNAHKAFDVSQVKIALEFCISQEANGKVCISFENSRSFISAVKSCHQMQFSSTKTYILAGCLGGLGSSLSDWMVSRGARNLIFLSRSGVARERARKQVEKLTTNGANVQVIAGNLTEYDDVERAVTQSQTPIGGVIHAAMQMEDGLFSTQMTLEKWYKSLNPKVMGAWNLHKALIDRDKDLDFFLMTSSVASTIGLISESNYCAANSFLDNFARFRRKQGLPALTIGLGAIADVGYLVDNEGAGQALTRRGIFSYSQAEIIRMIDLVLSHDARAKEDRDSSVRSGGTWSDGFVFTGLELYGLQELIQDGVNAHLQFLEDPRSLILATALQTTKTVRRSSDDAADSMKMSVREALNLSTNAPNGGGILLQAVEGLLVETLANLLLLSHDRIDLTIPLATFGLDSMLATELRNAVFKAFGVDLPFSTIIQYGRTAQELAALLKVALYEQHKLKI